MRGHRGRVLLLDRDASVRAMLVLGLAHHGWDADPCADAVRALARLAEAPLAYQVLVVDLATAGSSATSLMARARAIAPALPVLALALDPGGPPDDVAAVLSKPVTLDVLDAALSRAIEGRDAGAR